MNKAIIQRRPLAHSVRITMAPIVMTFRATRFRIPPCSDEAADAIPRYAENGLPYRRARNNIDSTANASNCNA